jgi:hypothetical protein
MLVPEKTNKKAEENTQSIKFNIPMCVIQKNKIRALSYYNSFLSKK